MWRELVMVVLSLMAIGAGLMAFTHAALGSDPGQRGTDWLKYGVFFGFVGVMLIVLVSGPLATTLVLGGIMIAGIRELVASSAGDRRLAAVVAVPGSLLVLLGLGHIAAFQVSGHGTEVIFLFLVVAVTDSFSQLWGRLLGQHKLCPRLSPGKTVEGLFLGVGSALVCSVVLSFLLAPDAVDSALLLGAITSVAAIAGDLAFSFIKRKMRIKDFANTLPGHGGVLDRLDSLIVAAPVFYWVHRLMFR